MKIDVNGVAEGLLQDLAFVQESKQKTFGYKRAAEAVFELERPLGDLIGTDDKLSKIAGIGPSSTRVILEVLATGASETVERAVAASGRAADVQRRRDLRRIFSAGRLSDRCSRILACGRRRPTTGATCKCIRLE